MSFLDSDAGRATLQAAAPEATHPPESDMDGSDSECSTTAAPPEVWYDTLSNFAAAVCDICRNVWTPVTPERRVHRVLFEDKRNDREVQVRAKFSCGGLELVVTVGNITLHKWRTRSKSVTVHRLIRRFRACGLIKAGQGAEIKDAYQTRTDQ
jgi:hypothetical protein